MNAPAPVSNGTAAAQREMIQLSGGSTIAIAQSGRGPDLVAIHGTLTTLEDMWLSCVPALAEHFRVVGMDRPGHGLSRRQRLVDASPLRQAEMIHEAVVAIGLRRPALLGHSFGGSVALAYAALYPEETAGVIALAPMCLPELRVEPLLFGVRGLPGIGEPVADWASAFQDPALLPLLWNAMFLPQSMPRVMSEGFPFALAAERVQMIAEGEDAMALSPALLRLAMGYPACPVPVRILGGSADLVVNNAIQGQIAATMLPHGSFQWIAGCGHMIHHVEIPEVVANAR